MNGTSDGTTVPNTGGAADAQVRQALAPRVRSHLGESAARVATFAVNASLIYALLACVVALWRLTKSSWVKLDFQLMIDHNDGADLLAVFATIVIALNVAAWWPRSVNTQPRPADAVPDRDEHETQAALYARYLTLSQAALLSGFGAIAVGEASFVHAVVVKGELLTGFAILLVAMVIAVFSLDAQAGLLEGKDLEDEVRRDRRDADLERLRRLVGQAQEGSPTLDNPLARWSDARTAARWSGSAARLWWLFEVVGIAAVMLVVPTIGLTYASRRDGYSWSQIAGTIPPLVFLFVILGALSVTMMIATTAALVYRHHVMAAAYALHVIAIPTLFSVLLVGLLLGTTASVNRWIAVACALWMLWSPVLITWRALAKSPQQIGVFPGGVARRLVRTAIVSRIKQLATPSTAQTPATQTTGWRLAIRPWRWRSAFLRWYEHASGVNRASTESGAGSPAAEQPASAPAA